MMTLPNNLDLTHSGSFDKGLKWAGNGGSAGEGLRRCSAWQGLTPAAGGGPESAMFEQVSQDRMVVQFAGAEAGTQPLTWGQKAILQDMQDSGNQFSMGGRFELPEGSTVEDAAARLSGLMVRHAALRMRLGTDRAGRLCQEVAGPGQTSLDILTLPDDAGRGRRGAVRGRSHGDLAARSGSTSIAIGRCEWRCSGIAAPACTWSGPSPTWLPTAGRTCCSSTT